MTAFGLQLHCFCDLKTMLLRCNCTAFAQELNGIAFSRPMCWGCKAGAMRLKRGVEAREMVLKHKKRLLKICSFHIYIVPLLTRK